MGQVIYTTLMIALYQISFGLTTEYSSKDCFSPTLCYHRFSQLNATSWLDAEKICRENDMILPEVVSEQQQLWTIEFFQSIPDVTQRMMFFGLHATTLNRERKYWRWESGDKSTYRLTNLSTDVTNGHECSFMSGEQYYMWQDVRCNVTTCYFNNCNLSVTCQVNLPEELATDILFDNSVTFIIICALVGVVIIILIVIFCHRRFCSLKKRNVYNIEDMYVYYDDARVGVEKKTQNMKHDNTYEYTEIDLEGENNEPCLTTSEYINSLHPNTTTITSGMAQISEDLRHDGNSYVVLDNDAYQSR